MTTTIATSRRPLTLLVARILAGAIGVVQAAGATFFLFIAPHESVWLGPWIDVPVVGLTLTGVALKLAFAVWPGLPSTRRIPLGLAAVGLGAATTLVKDPVYREPEGVIILLVDAVVLVLLLVAMRAGRRPVAG